MKRLFTVLVCLAMVAFIATSTSYAAPGKYLNGDPNFPMTGGHGGYIEYTDLSSCTISEETDEYYELSVGYSVWHRMGTDNPYRVRYFRYPKEGAARRPEYYNEKKDTWVTIPYQGRDVVEAYMQSHTPSDFVMNFHPWQYNMFCAAYQQVFGEVFSD